MMYHTRMDEDYICQNLMRDKTQVPAEVRNAGYRQLSLFDDDILTQAGISMNTCEALLTG